MLLGMNWNPFKKRQPKAEQPKSALQKALELNEVQKQYKPNRQLRRMSKNIGGTKITGRLP